MASFTPAKTGFSRVFIIEGRARPDHEPDYQSCLKAGSIAQAFGDVERIECPDPDRYGGFNQVGVIQGAIERGTITLTGRYASDLSSDLMRLAKARCPADVQIHFGACTDPRVFNAFTKAIVFEDAVLTNYNTEDLGALGSDENAKVDESTDISFDEMYEVLQLYFARRGDNVVHNPVLDVVICDIASCGDCNEESDGCEHIYTVTESFGGSPGTAADIIYSIDKGVTWALDEINSMVADEEPDALACLGDYVVVVSEDTESLHYKLKATIDAGGAGGWVENDIGFVATHGPIDIWSVGTYAFIAAEDGYVYGSSDPTVGVTVLDAGIATNADLTAVHAISDEFAVAVGEGDVIVWTQDRVTWQAATATGSGDDLEAVWIKTIDEWFVGTDAGDIYYTLDGGVTWTQTVMPGTNVTEVDDIAFATDSVAYACGTANGAGIAWRSYNGGYDWVVMPEGVGAFPASVRFDALAACTEDPNFEVIVGEIAADDGIILVLQD